MFSLPSRFYKDDVYTKTLVFLPPKNQTHLIVMKFPLILLKQYERK